MKTVIIEVTEKKYPTIITLREIATAIYGRVPPIEARPETVSLRSRNVIRFTDAHEPEWMTIREACRRMVVVIEKVRGISIKIEGVTL